MLFCWPVLWGPLQARGCSPNIKSHPYPKPRLSIGKNGGEGHVVDVPLGLSPYQTAGATLAQCNRGRTRTRTEILSYDSRLSSRESPGRGGVTPSSPQLRNKPRRCRDGRGCRPWLLSIPTDSGRHRSNSVKTRENSHCLLGRRARLPTLDNGCPSCRRGAACRLV